MQKGSAGVETITRGSVCPYKGPSYFRVVTSDIPGNASRISVESVEESDNHIDGADCIR